MRCGGCGKCDLHWDCFVEFTSASTKLQCPDDEWFYINGEDHEDYSSNPLPLALCLTCLAIEFKAQYSFRNKLTGVATAFDGERLAAAAAEAAAAAPKVASVEVALLRSHEGGDQGEPRQDSREIGGSCSQTVEGLLGDLNDIITMLDDEDEVPSDEEDQGAFESSVEAELGVLAIEAALLDGSLDAKGLVWDNIEEARQFVRSWALQRGYNVGFTGSAVAGKSEAYCKQGD
jgi:hypothetical protein